MFYFYLIINVIIIIYLFILQFRKQLGVSVIRLPQLLKGGKSGSELSLLNKGSWLLCICLLSYDVEERLRENEMMK